MSTDARWYEIGNFRILAKPLHLNPAFVTHHIYSKGEFIGKQLSMPNLQQCEDRLSEHRAEREPQASGFKPYTVHAGGAARNGRPGRP